MTRRKRLEKNPRLLFWGKALTELKTMNAIVVLFYLHRGVTMEEVFILGMVWSVMMIVLEVPSGYLADWIGRKRTLILGSFCILAAWAAVFFAEGFWPFVGVFSLMAASSALFSGADEAFLYDTLKEIGREGEMTKQNGRLQSARHIAKIFLPTIGALIAKDLLEWQFRIIIGIDLIAAVASLFLLFGLIEPRKTRSEAVYEKGIFRESIATIRQDSFLLRAASNKVLIFSASVIIWRAYQPFFVDLGVSIIWMAVFYFFLHVFAFFGKWFIHEIERKIPTRALLMGTAGVMGIALLVVTFVQVSWLAFVLMLLAFTMANMREPLFADAINKRINSRSRATTLSNLNLLKSIFDIPLWLIAAYVSQFSVAYVFLVGGFVAIGVLIFLPIRKKDLTFPALGQELNSEQAVSP